MIKKIISIILVISLVLLTGCQKESSESTDEFDQESGISEESIDETSLDEVDEDMQIDEEGLFE
ncbi:MAG: hypothetical protein PHG05_01470 [Candidatus Nanoarchaeia archaeon]|nr:hypothetical protein [Candidatus Nanoarchaeia archaeon]